MIESLVFGLVILAITSLWVLIEQRKSPKFLFWFIPLLLVLVSSTYVTYTSILGLPKVAIPEEEILSVLATPVIFLPSPNTKFE